MNISVAMFEQQDFFSLPPLGHRGVLYFNEPPPCKLDELINFSIGQVEPKIVQGVVVAIEPPGSNIRAPRLDKLGEKWKVHWVSLQEGEILPADMATPAFVCGNCHGKSKVFDTRKVGLSVQRSRECLKCKRRWVTIEVRTGEIKAARKRKS